jgi:uncharacterized membrane protein
MKVAILLLALSFAACGSGDEDEELSLPTVDCKSAAGVPTFSQVDAFTTCSACHSSKLTGTARKEAPADINFDDYASAKAHAEIAVSEVNSGAMPPADSKLMLTQSAKDKLYLWGLCGTPNN